MSACGGDPDADAGGLPPTTPWPASYAHDLSEIGQSGAQVDIEPWKWTVISYAVVPGNDDPLDREAFRAELRAALDEWSRVTEFKRQFYEEDDANSAQFIFAFKAPYHSETCDDGFTDGETTIAHAFTSNSPCLAGVVHLNAGLEWYTDGSNRFGTYDLRSALLHETGHLLGLPHIDTPGHIMYPEYVGVVRRLTDQEGADAIQVIDETQ